MTLRAAIVGCGKIADDHAEHLQRLDGVEVVAVCDLEPIMAEQLAERFGIPHHYTNFDQLLAEQVPDVVHITTPPQSHLALTEAAAAAGCHVWVEKPLAMNHEQGKQLVAAMEKAGKVLTIGHSYWFDPPAIKMRELVDQGVLGDPVHVESWFGYSLDSAFGAAILGSPDNWVHHLPGKLFHNNIDHLLNKLLEFVTDDEPMVHAISFTNRETNYGDIRDDLHDELRIMLKGEKVTAYGTFSGSAKPGGQMCRVYGTENTIEADYALRTVTVAQKAKFPTDVGRLMPAFGRAKDIMKAASSNVGAFARSEFQYFAGFHTLLEKFYDSIKNGGPPPIAYRDMLRLAWVLDQIWEQINPPRSLAPGNPGGLLTNSTAEVEAS